MELNVTRDAVCTCQEVFTGTSEQPIDLDIALPDYCPDISRMLKCQAVPQITVRSISGDRLTVEGSTIIRVFYGDEEGHLRCCELSSAFSSEFDLKTVPQQPIVHTDVRVDFINCRAVTRRRIDLHCAFTITAHVWGQRRQELVTGIQGEGVRTRTASLPVTGHIASVQQPFVLSEEFMPESGRAAPETVLRFSAQGRVTDCRVVAGKVIVKGEAEVLVLYETDSTKGELDTAVFTVPFSQIVDMEGADGETTCSARLELLSVQVRLNSKPSGAVFEAELRGVVTVHLHRMQTVRLVQDAYSTRWEGEPVTETVQLPVQHEPVDRMVEIHGTLPDCRMASVTDAWSELRSFSAAVKDGALQWTGRLGVSLLLQDEDGKAAYRETVLEPTDRIPWQEGDVRLDPQVPVEHMAYRPTAAGELEVRARVRLYSPVQIVRPVQTVQAFVPDLQHPKVQDTSCGLILYYAEPGESIWQIARCCCTTEEAVRAENDLQGETVESAGMLLIPMA